MKRVLLAILIFFSFNQVYALEKCTPSKDYLAYQELSEEEKANYDEPIYCNEIKNNEVNPTVQVAFQLKNRINRLITSSYTTSSQRYNAYEEGYITSIKNQYSLGTCWSFSAISSVESNALKNGLEAYDFSEAHMIYSLISGAYSDEAGKVGKYKTQNMNGGQVNYASTYYFNGVGQLLEEEMEYPRTYTPITINDYIEGRDIISIKKFEINNTNDYGKCSDIEIETIKNKLLDYGAVQGSMYMDETLFKDSDKNYYISTLSNSTSANHGISIIGWDDTISKDKFQGATRNGAWIIKNSWGENWSSDGFFYISYDDNFICKNVASYGGVSTEKFDYKYKAADVVGLPEFYFDNSFYSSARFTKQSSGKEEIKRVSFPTGENMTYKIYLAKTNNLNNRSSWELLKEGTSSVLGIDSVDLENITINDDFTIIAEYRVNTGKVSSVITLCNDNKDSTDFEISSGINYYSNNGIAWYDMHEIQVGTSTINCEPNLYAYTNAIEEEENNDVQLSISTINKKDENTVNVTISQENVDTNNITFKILGANNTDVTSHFTITPAYENNQITIKNDNTIAGTFTLKMYYEDKIISKNFVLNEIIQALNNKTKVNTNNITILVDKDKTYNLKNLTDSLSLKNATIKVYNSSNSIVNQNTSPLGTDYKVVTSNNKNYSIIIKGDVTGDGTVNSADLLKIVKYLKGSTQLSNGQKTASDCTNDNTINSADLLKIVKYLKGTTTISM